MKPNPENSDASQGDPHEYEKIGKVTSKAVLKHTRRTWKQWIASLEKAGARWWTYQEIVAYLRTKRGLSPWWRHEVARGFEIAIGRRREGQDAKGKYMVTATKSLPHGVREVWDALMSERGMEIWLNPLYRVDLQPKSQFETNDGYFGEVRTLSRYRRLRLFWQDPHWEKHTVVEVMLVSRPGKKSILVFNHTAIHDTKTKSLLRERWRKAADRIPELFTERP